jgi:RNA-directed DNA polymerase
MNRFLKYWRLTNRGEAFQARVIAYADDFVILSRGFAAEALAWTKAVMSRLGLTLNEVKTSLRDARQERFDFLGYSFGPHRYKANGKWYLSASPSRKGVTRRFGGGKSNARGTPQGGVASPMLAQHLHEPVPEVAGG